MDVTWTIGELAERAVAVLAAGESAQVNGRVRDLPNERLIRWYTTIGLVDPPAGRRGRTALYGPRHLLQLVAVKRRQAAGRSIAEIQLELTAATDATLERIAALPPGAMDSAAEVPFPAAGATATGSTPGTATPDAGTTDAETADSETADSVRRPTRPHPEAAPHDDTATPRAASTETGPPADGAQQVDDAQQAGGAQEAGGAQQSDDARRLGSARQSDGAQQADGGAQTRGRFWSARPDMSFGRATVAADYARPAPRVVQGVRLAPDLTLVLEVGSLSADDLHAIETAARPLLDELASRGLIASPADSAHSPADPPRRPQ
ncbi:MerR family transcriptional regulator [Actinomadura nitritigenes]|uniref:MerR family transcriptional regulator n=1 Tax=Actinomadura nitritigenes TaxID=134602 RepID=UPI003D94CD53